MCTVQSELQCDVMCCTVLQHAGVARNDICGVVYRGVFARIVFAVLYVEYSKHYSSKHTSVYNSADVINILTTRRVQQTLLTTSYGSFAKEP